jgi:hypothetical protein
MGLNSDWTLWEDAFLKKARRKFGSNWDLLADMLNGAPNFDGRARSARQCRDRMETLLKLNMSRFRDVDASLKAESVVSQYPWARGSRWVGDVLWNGGVDYEGASTVSKSEIDAIDKQAQPAINSTHLEQNFGKIIRAMNYQVRDGKNAADDPGASNAFDAVIMPNVADGKADAKGFGSHYTQALLLSQLEMKYKKSGEVNETKDTGASIASSVSAAGAAAAAAAAASSPSSLSSSSLSDPPVFVSPLRLMKAKLTGQTQRTETGRKIHNADQFNEDIGVTFPFKQSSAYRGGSRGSARNRKFNADDLVKAAADRARLNHQSLNLLLQQPHGHTLRQEIQAVFRDKMGSIEKSVDKITKILLAAQKKLSGLARSKKRAASRKATGGGKGRKKAKKGSPKPKVGSTPKGKSKGASAKGAAKSKAGASSQTSTKSEAAAASGTAANEKPASEGKD